MVVALISTWIYYLIIDGHEFRFGCGSEMKMICPEWLEECYKEMEPAPDGSVAATICPIKNEEAGCIYKNVEVCKYVWDFGSWINGGF